MAAVEGKFQYAIRPMVEEDLDAVLAIASTLREAPHWPRSAYEDALRGARDGAGVLRRVALVAEDGADDGIEIVGYAMANLVGAVSELEFVAVARHRQRAGAGIALLRALIGDCEGRGAEEMLLEVRPSNRAAIGAYERAGFRSIGLRRGYYLDPVEDALLMRLKIGAGADRALEMSCG